MAREYFLSTARLSFSCWSEDDLPLALALWGDPLVTRFVGGPFSQEQIRKRLSEEIACLDAYGFQYWPLFLRANDEFAGCCGMRAYKPAEQIPAFGFYLRPVQWGQGLASEAGHAAIEHAFEPLGARAIFAGRHPENARSQKALEKLGFRYTHDQLYPPTGLMHPSYLLEQPLRAPTGRSQPATSAHASLPESNGARRGLGADERKGRERRMEADLRYPIGKPERPEELTEQQRLAFIAAIAETPAKLRAAVSGLNQEQLDTPYRPGGWTVRQVVHHLPDSHMNAYVRFKLALTENEPTIKPYQEAAWANLPDSKGPIEPSLALLDSLHQRWIELLGRLGPADWQKKFNHPESGLNTLDKSLAIYGWHGRHHIAHITALRERKGWK